MSDPDSVGTEKEDEEFEIDLEGASNNPEEGIYIVECIAVTRDVSEAGNPMWVWDFSIVGKEDGDQTHAGAILRCWTALTQAAMWKVEETVVALGLAQAGEKALFKKKDVIGVRCRAKLVEEEYEGRKRAKIDSLGPHPKGAGFRGKAGPDPDSEDVPF